MHIWTFWLWKWNACPQKPILWYFTCLYSEILPKIQVGCLKQLQPPWKKKFFFHVWDIRDTFYKCKKKKKFKGGPKKIFLTPIPPPQKSWFYKKRQIFLCLSDYEKKNLKNLKLCLYSEILPKIQVGCLKKFLPLWKKNFFFHVWDIWDTFYKRKKKKN